MPCFVDPALSVCTDVGSDPVPVGRYRFLSISKLYRRLPRLVLRSCGRARAHNRSLANVQAMSRYGTLPDAVLTRVLLCDTLDSTDKVQCEGVCKSWRDLLRCSQTATRGIWLEKLVLKLDLFESGSRSKRNEKLSFSAERKNVAEVQLSQMSGEPSAADLTFVAWLARRAAGVQRVVLLLSGTPQWQLALVVSALHHSSTLVPPGPEVRLITGDPECCLCHFACLHCLFSLWAQL